jgi:aryl-alcohol dehydrogenase-like predicted oxidoreductase
MEYVRLGDSGLRVSRIALGCMSYGDPTRGLHSWTLDEDASQPFFQQAVELGITLWDTANVYQAGSSEEFVGRAIKTYARREEIVVATKVSGKMHDGPGGSGLSRVAIMEQVDASLRRLDTDYIDLYLIHRFDPDTPVEETMEGLHDVVGPLSRRVVDERLAVRQDAARRRTPRLDAVRRDAGSVQPDQA